MRLIPPRPQDLEGKDDGNQKHKVDWKQDLRDSLDVRVGARDADQSDADPGIIIGNVLINPWDPTDQPFPGSASLERGPCGDVLST